MKFFSFFLPVMRFGRLVKFRLVHWQKQRFHCPVCGWKGPFDDLDVPTGFREHASCPRCGALERHRLQHLVLWQVLKGKDPSSMKTLHIAPEDFFRRTFAKKFGLYVTADLAMKDVDVHADLSELPFPTGSFDLVYASHVLEHIQDDDRCIAEIRRVLRPEGIAVLPVPVIAEKTLEYPAPNELESGHVRAPGPDYFDRYRRHFPLVKIFTSGDVDPSCQPYILEDRQRETVQRLSRSQMAGARHVDYVPVCFLCDCSADI